LQVGSEKAEFIQPIAPFPYIFTAPNARVVAPVVFFSGPYKAEDLAKAQGKIAVFEPTDPEFDALTASRQAFAAGAKGGIVAADSHPPAYLEFPQSLDDRKYENNRNLYWINEPSRQMALMYEDTAYRESAPLYLEGPVFYVDSQTTTFAHLQEL